MIHVPLPSFPTPDHAGTGFYRRASRDPFLITLLGEKRPGVARVYDEVPGDNIEAGDFPRITYAPLTASTVQAEGGYYEVWVQVNIWAWSEKPSAGRSVIASIDRRLEALFVWKRWTWNGAMLYSAPWQVRPGAVGNPKLLRRIRELKISVSPATLIVAA